MNHVVIEKKCIIILWALYLIGAFFFIIAHYDLYDCHKRIIVCLDMSSRAQLHKKKYEPLMIANEQQSSCTYVNRELQYLHAHSASHLKRCGIDLAQRKNDDASKKMDKALRMTSARKKRTSTATRGAIKRRSTRFLKQSMHDHALFRWPIDKREFWLSSFFGPRKKPDRSWGYHYGIDMAALKGTLVHAAASGTVSYAGYQRGYGNTILISHAGRYTTRYAHLDTIAVSQGTVVSVGRYIGTVGDTGYTITRGRDASHLHFEVSIRGKQVNPLPLLPGL